MRTRSLAAGENIIIHGTLASVSYADELLRDLDQYGYQNLTIISVDRPASDASDQALRRWWDDRLTNKDGLGGRFVRPGSSEAITGTTRRHPIAQRTPPSFGTALPNSIGTSSSSVSSRRDRTPQRVAFTRVNA